MKTNGTGKKSDEDLTKLARDVFPLRPGEIVSHLDLKKPRYSETAAYGHFGRELELFTWKIQIWSKNYYKVYRRKYV